MNMKQLGQALLGFVLVVIGCIVFLMNIHVSSFSFFWRYRNVNVGAFLLILVAISFITLLVKYNKLTVGVFWSLVAVFFITIILSLDFYVTYLSAFELVLIIGTICVGIALLLKSLVFTKGMKEEDKDPYLK
ncbi:MAG: hypothetical protein VZQ50_05345 [Lachnospiraceae bacterium]|nr:hypothetical protein [Lachnospiraceae bacterium]